MSTVLFLMVITVKLQMISAIWNGIVTVRVQKGDKVVLRCCSSATEKSWLGPDFNMSAHKKSLIYFSNYRKHPKLNLSKYFVQTMKGNYDLTIFDFQQEDVGFYHCRFHNNRTFDETKYNVSLLDEGVETSTIGYERRKDIGNAQGIQVNIKETSFELPANQRYPNHNSELTTTFIVVFLLVISLTILGITARRKWGTLGRGMNYIVLSFRGDTERTILSEDTAEPHDIMDEQAGKSDGLNYVEVLTVPLAAGETRIRENENKKMYAEIDHSLKT